MAGKKPVKFRRPRPPRQFAPPTIWPELATSYVFNPRAWEAPDQSAWTDPFDDRRFVLYANTLRDKFGYVRFVGLPTQGGPEDTPIDRLFVEPALSSERIDPTSPPKDAPVLTPLLQSVIDHPRLVVLGDPGSGKSTLVNWIVLNFTAREQNQLRATAGPLVPLAIILRDLEIDAQMTWDDLLRRFVAHPTGRAFGSVDQVERYLSRGQAIVLVDGLDEAGGIEVRRNVAAVLRSAFQRYPSARWVLTSRVVGYDEAPVESVLLSPSEIEIADWNFEGLNVLGSRPRATVFQPALSRLYVAPFDDARIAMFIRNWHEQHETDRTVRPARVAELLEAIDRSPEVKALARVPNLLTMVALVYRVYLRLPDGRALLYERIAQAYLETIETARRLPTLGHTLEDMKRWLGYAAFQMQRARFGKASSDDKERGILATRQQLVDWIAFAMARGGAVTPSQQATATAFVDWVARRAGLVIPRSEEFFAFAHLSFQEYFAAWFIAEQITGPAWNKPGRTPPPIAAGTELPSLQSFRDDARWHETITLLFELLAVRGDWPDEMLTLLFDFESRAAWPTELNLAMDYPSFSGRIELLVTIAMDVHSGLSPSLRDRAFHHAWYGGSALLTQDIWQFIGKKVLERLFAFDDDGEQPAVNTLTSLAEPARLKRLLLSKGSETIVDRLDVLRPALRHVLHLIMDGQQFDDESLSVITRPDTGLPALTTLHLNNTAVTNAGVAALACPGTGLKSLTSLTLNGSGVSDVGVAALARSDTELKALSTLSLISTRTTDAAVAALAHPATGLKALKSLTLSGDGATDAGMVALARPDMGLHMLANLFLYNTEMSDKALTALAQPDSGLASLTTLCIFSPRMTDKGLATLARPDAGLKALTTLYLSHSGVTDAGVSLLRKARPHLTVLK